MNGVRRGGLWARLPLWAKGFVVAFLPVAVLLSLTPLVNTAEGSTNSGALDRAQLRRLLDQQKLDALLLTLLKAETAIRGYVATHDEEFLTPYGKAVDNLPDVLAPLDDLVRDDMTFATRVARIRALTREVMENHATLRRLVQNSGSTAAERRLLLEQRELLNDIRSEIQAMERAAP